MQTLKEIRNVVQSKYNFETTEILSILKPFFTVIRSEDLTGPITGVALSSLEKFLKHPWIKEDTIGGKAIMKEIIDAIRQCQFEVTDMQSDEAVLTRVLEVFTAAIECSAGILLEEKTILEIFKSCYKIGRETRPTELLRRSAESHLVSIIEIIFKRVLQEKTGEMPSLYEYLCDLCDPEKEGKSAALRLLGLTLANTLIEILGSSIQRFPRLLNLTVNNYSRALLRNSVTTNVLLFSQTIRGTVNLFYSCAPFIHDQIECFILCFARIAESKTSSNEHHELILEMFQELLRDANFCTYLFVHFDCVESSFDLFDFICKFLNKSSFPTKDGEHLNIRHILSLQALLNILSGIAERAHEENKLSVEKQIELMNSKSNKLKTFAAIEIFNVSPQKGIKYLQDNNMISKEFDPKEFSQILRKNQKWISKSALAELLKKEKRVLSEYMQTFDFSSLSADEALRLLIRNFHLIGSTETIESILTAFSTKYFEDNKDKGIIFEDSEAVLFFTFSVTMLNSDLHNPRNGVKMSLEQFIKMTQNETNRKTSNPIPREELERVYNAILVRKFEYENNFKDEFKENILWENTVKTSDRYYAENPHVFAMQGHVDCEMFQNIYGKVISATCVILDQTEDPTVMEYIRNGFLECSKIASFYKLTSVFDNLVISLCKFTEILSPSVENSVVSFGNNSKSQLATKTVFNITRNYGDNLREGWKNILDFILRLYELNLLPKNILLAEPFAEESKIYAIAYEKNRKERKNSSSGFGFFGFFNNTTEDDVESKKSEEKARNCIESCHIPELLKDAKILHQPSLEYLVKAIIFKSIGYSAGREDSFLTKMFCFDLLTDVSISNKDRAFIIWPFIMDHYKNLIGEVVTDFEKHKKLKQDKTILMERLIICLLRTCSRLMHLDEMRNNLYQALLLLFLPNSMPTPLIKLFHVQIVAGLNLVVTNGSKFIKEPSIWNLILDTLRIVSTNKEVRIKAVETIILIVKENEFVWPENVPNCVQASIMIGTIYVVDVLTGFHDRILSNTEALSKPSQLWCKAWLSILEGFAKLSTCTDADIRHTSLIQLQRMFLDNKVALLPSDLIVSSFHIIIFSLLDQLVNQSVNDIEETRLRAIQLLAKTFLNFLTILQQAEKLSEIWNETLTYMKKYYVDAKKGSSISEAVPELLKNLVLVMNSQNIFKENPKLWEITREQMDGPFVELIKDIKPEGSEIPPVETEKE